MNRSTKKKWKARIYGHIQSNPIEVASSIITNEIEVFFMESMSQKNDMQKTIERLTKRLKETTREVQ